MRTIGHEINNQGEGWGLLDFSSAYFDQARQDGRDGQAGRLRLARRWHRGAGTGGFYDLLGPNNYNVERRVVRQAPRSEPDLQGRAASRGVGDWTVGLIGRNLFTFTSYSGYDPEIGVDRRFNGRLGLINQMDAFGFPTLRTFTFTVTRASRSRPDDSISEIRPAARGSGVGGRLGACNSSR